jgi:hypothetical protein
MCPQLRFGPEAEIPVEAEGVAALTPEEASARPVRCPLRQ